MSPFYITSLLGETRLGEYRVPAPGRKRTRGHTDMQNWCMMPPGQVETGGGI